MPRDVVVIFVHGINVTSQDYYEPMRDALLQAMPDRSRDHVAFRAVFWADIVRGRQQEYLLYARNSTRFDGTALHKLVIEGLGDAAAYQKTWRRENSAYYDIQDRVRRTLHDAADGRQDVRPLVFIGHSLGCQIISSFAWDLHKIKKPRIAPDGTLIRSPYQADDPFFRQIGHAVDASYAEHLHDASELERLDTFAAFVSMGSNMPLFTFTFGPQNVVPISRSSDPRRVPAAFPGPAVDDILLAQSRWLNFYSLNDPLGYPLKPLNDDYDGDPLLSDRAVRSEGVLRSMLLRGRIRQLNALKAHTGYWTNKTVVKESSRLIYNLIYADEIAAQPQSGPKASTVRGEAARAEDGPR